MFFLINHFIVLKFNTVYASYQQEPNTVGVSTYQRIQERIQR